jgi:hypothetical protein
MNRPKRDGIAGLPARGVARFREFLRGIFNAAVRYSRDRKAARQAQRDLRCSGQKLTDEMERKIIQRFTRNRSFRV